MIGFFQGVEKLCNCLVSYKIVSINFGYPCCKGYEYNNLY